MRLSHLYLQDVLVEKRPDFPGMKKYEGTPFAKALRSKGKEQEEVADNVGVDPSTISRWKSRTRKPSFDNLRQAVKKMGTQASTLWPELSL